jgi:hypothetical protein
MSTKKAFAAIVPNQRIRGCDPAGCGSFGADRGGHKHQGVDIVTTVGQNILSPILGVISRFPFPYPGDTKYTGIEIKNDVFTVKIFYVTPVLKIGTTVAIGTKIAIAQNIAARYSVQMTNHAHIEVRETQSGKLIDPTKFFV